MCITNGVTCTPALECVAYSKELCESTPSLRSPFKCKLDGETCRDYKCTEADASLTTTPACSNWLAGCKTTGAGCIDVIPTCASYQGTSETCPKMKGSDGNCEFNPDGTNCRLRVCTGADPSTSTDPDCATYQTGCVTTGKGCIATRGSCSSYSGNASTCIGYIGTDGKCAGDTNGTQCRARKCNEKTATTDPECDDWKTGCKSNGKQCVDALGACSSYQGTITTCLGLKGTDGNCKGTSATSGNCVPKECVADSTANFTTQAQCEAIQTSCKTTGKGCVATLSACSSYAYTDADGASCNSLFGSDGRCKPGTGGRCAARVCTEAPSSYSQNSQCQDYKSGCVTTGAGCIQQGVCTDTVKQVTCEGTSTCAWNSICVSKVNCGQLPTKSICESVKINNKSCKWQSNSCRNATCDDFIFTEDSICSTNYPGCVTNGTRCVDGSDCAAQFKGTRDTCRGFTAKCTNDDGATATTACKSRTCDDPYLTYDNDTECDNYKTGCVTKGTGCISDSAQCTSYTGTPDQCDKFKGNKTKRCWNTGAANVSGTCEDKLCTQATGMTGDTTCEAFLSGCLFDGNGSCVDKSDSCSSYYGDSTTCRNFTGNSGLNPCWVGTSGRCKSKVCSDDTSSQTDGACNTFFEDKCVTKGTGCIEKIQSCSAYRGITTDCEKFSGNSGADKCTRLEACVSKSTTCIQKTGVSTNSDCLAYHNDCRWKFGDTTCMQVQTACTSYTLTGTGDSDKQSYCNSITISSGANCSYNTSITGTCSARACNLWVSTLTGITCENYNGPASCKLNGTFCYSANTCDQYTIPSGTTDKLAWCNLMFDNSATPKKCSYVSGATCSAIDTCEEIISATNAAECNLYLNDGTCQYANNKCITTKTACTGYSIIGITSQATYCSALKSDNSGTVKQCAYISTTTTTCVDAVPVTVVVTIPDPPAAITITACNSIASPTQQADCNLGSGSCKYYLSACYVRVACASYTIPASANDADKKQYFCQNMQDITTEEYCSYDSTGNSGSGACAAGKTACTEYTGLTAASAANDSNDVANKLACSKLRIKTGSACAYDQTQTTKTTCHAPADAAASCTVITADITADADCALRTILGCKWGGGSNTNCVARAACTELTPTGTDDAKTTTCQAIVGADSNYCTFTSGGANCVAAQALCSGYVGLTANTELETCQKKVNQKGKRCSWSTGSTCGDAQATCAGYSGLTVSDKLTYCQARIDQVGVKCSWNLGNVCIAAPKTCAEWASLPTSSQLEFCTARIKSDGTKCTWGYNGATCIEQLSNCSGFNALPTSGQLEYCQARTNTSGGKCSWTSGQTACRNATCEDTISPQSLADCNVIGLGCTYSPQNRVCYIKQTACTSYNLPGTLTLLADKSSYCNNLVNDASGKCTYYSGNTCAVVDNCTAYTVSGLTDFDTKFATCQKAIPSSGTCTYFSGNTCVAVAACNSYTGGTSGTIVVDCAKQKNLAGLLCYGANTDCAAATCENVTGASSIADCNKYATGCVYYNSKCYTGTSNCAYTTTGSGSIAFCNGIKNTNGDFCTADSDSDATCRQRACDDDATDSFQTHLECKTYSSLCKSDGQGCIDASTACGNQQGVKNYCDWALDTDNKSTCAQGTPATSADNCTALSCDLNVTAISDSECQTFNSDCLNKGLGCIHKTKPCSSYYGTKDQCQLFIGNSKKCFGTSVGTKAACRDRLCSDLTAATSDSDCENFLGGCLFNGVGCVNKSDPCSSYKGTQATCSGFKGSNQTKLCWGASTTVVSSCADRKCTDKAGTTDKECQDFLPALASTPTVQQCITNGTGCVDKGKSCSTFKGNDETCGQFTATDGPCKASTVSAQAVACAPRVCYEAPNTFTTDAQCTQYHPTCKTTGRGCKDSVACGDYTSSTSCVANTSCQWAGQCRGQPATCGSLTAYGQTICVNTPLSNGKKCAWYIGASTSGCRDFTCADYEGTLITHKDCSDKDTSCTTSGAGCVTIGVCTNYKSQSVCEAANTTEVSVRCAWNSTAAVCRQRQCADGAFTTDELCNTWLAGCKTTGTVCVGPTFGCDVFTGNPKLCLKNSVGNPCLYVDGVCYDYDNCTDVSNASFAFCQSFSTQCVPTTTTCRAITLCDKYEDINSCQIGINNTKCGWQPDNKCKEFTACNDAAGASTPACAAWGAKCVSDGTKCVDQGTCSSYLTDPACQNAGTDGSCQWTGTSCRLRECTDKVGTSDGECLAFTVKSGLCTTDGTKCVARATCTSYLTEAACTIGADGIPCVYDLPVGQTTGTKTCRPKECTDIKGTTNDACIGLIPNKACVSNGVNCVKQDTCANYKNKLSCKGGGSDGKCAFTPAPTVADPNNGTCQQFKSCDVANNDQDACNSKPKACKWTSTTSGTTTTTKCSVMDCPGIAAGTTCNPIPSFDDTTYTICVLANGACTAGDPQTITQDQCYRSTVYSYTWNEATNKCVGCKSSNSNNNNSTNPNNTDNNNTNTDDNGYILGVTIPLVLMGIFA